MKKIRLFNNIKNIVIVGYLLLFIVMIYGIVHIYNNLVDFSERKTKGEDLKELVIVSNTISKLFELECTQHLITSEKAYQYFDKYNDIRPQIFADLDTLKSLTNETQRINKLDTIILLLDKKEKNLKEITALLDSIRQAPTIKSSTVSSFLPRKVNKDIDELMARNNVFITEENSDTTVIKGEQKRLFGRLRDAFAGVQDSTVIVDNRPQITQENFSLVLDTVVNMIRYTEKLDLDKQKNLQYQLFLRQVAMNNTNTLLATRINELLKGIELEELNKSIQLIQDKELVLSKSQKTVFRVSWVAIAIALIFGLMFIIDINRDIRYREKLESSNKKIKDLLELREKLMLAISHDIKAPVSSIQGYIELLSSDHSVDKKRKYLQNMKNSTNHILDLVTDLLDTRKLNDGLWLKKEITFNLHELCNDVINNFVPIAHTKNLELKYNNNISTNFYVFSDPYMLRKVFQNIISNAIKYTPKGFVEVRCGVENSGIQFVVKDTGYGISKEDQELIFQEFKQLNKAYSNHKIEGVGLGLAIVKGLIHELNGTIRLESELNKGSQFTVWLPLEEKTMPAANKSAASKINNVKLDGISVLAIDDDPMQLTMLSELLKLKNMRVTTENVPENAVKILNKQKFDIIFIDIQMPNMNGLELVKKMSELNLETPKIALSANSEISLKDIRNHGFNDFLPKPFDLSTISGFIDKYVNKQASENQNTEPKSHGSVFNLIDFVKEDTASSLAILNSFQEETTQNLSALQVAFDKNDTLQKAHLSHKMMPLFKMIGNDELVDMLLRLEVKQDISKEEEMRIIQLIKSDIAEAKRLIDKIQTK